MDPLIAVYDACVLYSGFLRDFLVRLAIRGRHDGVLRARWTGRIHGEWMRAVLGQKAASRSYLMKTRRLMDGHVHGSRVHGYERWERRLEQLGVSMPDPEDRHALAAALACVANVVVTFNTKDFPPAALAPFGVAAVTPDALALSLLDCGVVTETAREHRAALKDPPLSPEEYLQWLRNNGLPGTADALGTSSI